MKNRGGGRVEEEGVGGCLFLETYQLPQSDPRGVCSPKHRLGAASAHMPSHFMEPDSVSCHSPFHGSHNKHKDRFHHCEVIEVELVLSVAFSWSLPVYPML